MREIKFRAWDKEEKKFVALNSLVHIEANDGRPIHYHGEMGYLINCPDIELSQFTGLCDKNGKEIYEGDIAEWTVYPDETEQVKLRDSVGFSSGCFKLEKRVELLFNRMPHIEIIGNIYENPELLN